VRGPAGSSADFDYMVWGLRIGFEEQSIVQPKKDDSKIPSMHQHEEFFKDDPSLRSFTALARFKGIEESVHGRKNVDLSRAGSLRDAVGVFSYRDPKELEHDPGRHATLPPAQPASSPESAGGASPAGTAAPLPVEGPAKQGGSVPGGSSGVADAGNGSATPMPATAAALDRFVAQGAIEDGDVVSLMPTAPGSVVRSAGPTDPLVIGCAQPVGADSTAAAPRPSMTAGQVAVASSHLALCHVDASNGAIAVGDRLTLSPAPGMAMKLDPGVAGATILGRAVSTRSPPATV